MCFQIDIIRFLKEIGFNRQSPCPLDKVDEWARVYDLVVLRPFDKHISFDVDVQRCRVYACRSCDVLVIMRMIQYAGAEDPQGPQ